MSRGRHRNFEDRYYEDTEFYGCIVKLKHSDWLSAHLHIRSLKQHKPLSSPYIYVCSYCDGLHVTSGRKYTDSQLLNSLEHLEKVRLHPAYTEKASEWVQARDAQLIVDLRAHLIERGRDEI